MLRDLLIRWGDRKFRKQARKTALSLKRDDLAAHDAPSPSLAIDLQYDQLDRTEEQARAALDEALVARERGDSHATVDHLQTARYHLLHQAAVLEAIQMEIDSERSYLDLARDRYRDRVEGEQIDLE